MDKTSNRIGGAVGYEVCTPGEVVGKQFGCIVDVSGDLSQLDFLISLLPSWLLRLIQAPHWVEK